MGLVVGDTTFRNLMDLTSQYGTIMTRTQTCLFVPLNTKQNPPVNLKPCPGRRPCIDPSRPRRHGDSSSQTRKVCPGMCMGNRAYTCGRCVSMGLFPSGLRTSRPVGDKQGERFIYWLPFNNSRLVYV